MLSCAWQWTPEQTDAVSKIAEVEAPVEAAVIEWRVTGTQKSEELVPGLCL
jgi:aspartate aminotransferase-like enzyme